MLIQNRWVLIKTARSAAGYTQKQFSDYMGIEQKYLSDLERGVAYPSFPLTVIISDKLNISLEFLEKGRSTTPHDTKIPWETMYYVPEAERINDRQYNTMQKIIRLWRKV